MKILALDTATENCSAALLTDAGVLVREERLGRGQAARILAMIAELLAESGVPLSQLTAVAFGCGPGAFTGVRLAASVTQGIAFAAGLPVVPVSDLRAVAQRVLDLPGDARAVLVCNDARMHEVYWGAFVRGADKLARPAAAERVSAPAAVTLPEGWDGTGVAGAGSGFTAYPELATRLDGVGGRVWGEFLPRAEEVAKLAVAEVRAGHLRSPEQAIPVYLRDDVARPSSA